MAPGQQGRIGTDLLAVGEPGAPALHDRERTTTYGELRRAVADRAGELASERRELVLLSGPPSTAWVVEYLAVLAAGHVPLLAGDRREALASTWSPRWSIHVEADHRSVHERDEHAPAAELHPELGLLLSTSGSTGSPKLVRLSHEGVLANARAIASSLELTAHDVGITSLPLHYCYGLSVLHSHLAVGASIALTSASVVDPCFVAALERHGVTSIAGVPHSFDLLEVAGPERIATSSLRLLTQAGGRLDDEARARWRQRAAAWGVDFVVMYGQTEATARLAVLPSRLAAEAGPDAVGLPVAGGSFEVVPVDGVDGDDIGELVFRGPNVMLGYGEEPADLALGRTVEALATGDLGRVDPVTGIVEVVGRRSRFVKPFGLRIDLDRVRLELADRADEVAVAGDDRGLVVAAPGADARRLRAAAAEVTGLPPGSIEVVERGPIPRTSSGKVDLAALLAQGRSKHAVAPGEAVGAAPPSAIVADVLGRMRLEASDTFSSAGGDSLSYVEASVRIEAVVGRLPDDWQHLTMAELDALVPSEAPAGIDTTVVLRAVGICAVVATHMDVVFFPGGAHLLLGVAGFNLSRFHLGIERASDRFRAIGRTVARVALPAIAVALAVLVLTDRYGWTTAALVNNYLGPRHHELGHWHFWFIEAYVQLCLVVGLLVAVPAVRRLERRAPFGFALALLGGAVALRGVTWWGIDDPFNLRFRTHAVAAFFVLGWLAHRSRTTAQKLVATAACLAVVPGFFGRPQREAFILAGLVLLVWARRVVVPQAAVRVVAVLAAASMWILISHFHIWPVLDARLPLAVAYPATLLAGVAIWRVAERAPRWARRSIEARGAPDAGAASGLDAVGRVGAQPG